MPVEHQINNANTCQGKINSFSQLENHLIVLHLSPKTEYVTFNDNLLLELWVLPTTDIHFEV